ncbi:hypothetical protein [Cytobacillus praedii]|uniref:Uncharacterized protein n=1 Tax=Cytobacillus praedii TaxID=1742358 RepID=A0A4R1AML4_9BACI|nr:hypothetical protein [Cytobacillus praedii]TCJ00958.1 hypothetical protein E0Y62_26375 [Cytobacillus praedii]
MEKSVFEHHSEDRKGNELIIKCEGTDDQELAKFGGLDLHIKATREMISNVSAASFPEKDGDLDIYYKIAALYLNEIGYLLRNSAFDSELFEGNTNIELVKMFLDDFDKNPILTKLVEKDDKEIKEYDAKMKKEEDEIWSSTMKDLNIKI